MLSFPVPGTRKWSPLRFRGHSHPKDALEGGEPPPPPPARPFRAPTQTIGRTAGAKGMDTKVTELFWWGGEGGGAGLSGA